MDIFPRNLGTTFNSNEKIYSFKGFLGSIIFAVLYIFMFYTYGKEII
jgi:hypothetical protein